MTTRNVRAPVRKPPAASAPKPAAAPLSAPKAGQAGTQSGPAASQVGQHSLLRKGARGDQVKSLQGFLKTNGYDLADDGKFGGKTAAALRQYQTDKGLKVDGVAGQETWGSFYGEKLGPGRDLLRKEPVSQPTGHSAKDTFDAGKGGAGTLPPKSLPKGSLPKGGAIWQRLASFAQSMGFHVTSTTGGHHNVGSKHAQGRAVDVRTKDHSAGQVNAFMKAARAQGITVHDERSRPISKRTGRPQAVWSGSHVHLEA